jgi:hypothetical protein
MNSIGQAEPEVSLQKVPHILLTLYTHLNFLYWCEHILSILKGTEKKIKKHA